MIPARNLQGAIKNQAPHSLSSGRGVNIDRYDSACVRLAETDYFVISFSDENSRELDGRKVTARSSTLQPPLDNFVRVVFRTQCPHGRSVKFVKT
jgi:hypothetical protein